MIEPWAGREQQEVPPRSDEPAWLPNSFVTYCCCLCGACNATLRCLWSVDWIDGYMRGGGVEGAIAARRVGRSTQEASTAMGKNRKRYCREGGVCKVEEKGCGEGG